MQRLVLIFVLIAGCSRDANAVEFPQTPVESRLLDDASDGQFDQFTLFEAALVAASPQLDTAPYTRRFQDHCAALQSRLQRATSDTEKIRVAFVFMHDEVLIGRYEIDCDDLARTLDIGNYNCVTATLLFQCFCEHLRLPVIPLAAKEHVWCRANVQPVFEVETTCAGWLNSSRGAATIEAGRATSARDISSVELVARVFYNHGLKLAQQRQFADAITAFRSGLHLDPNQRAGRRNLAAVWNNWAISMAGEARFSDAIRAIEEAEKYGGDPAELNHNRNFIYRRWMQTLCRSGNCEAAAAIVEQELERHPDNSFLRESFDEITAVLKK